MDIVSALFAENIDLRPVPGPSTRIDLTGIMFSLPAPSPPPVTVTPHLIVLVRCRPDEDGQGILEVVFRDEAGEQVARNVSPFQVEPGKFTYRLVRGELEYSDFGTIEAHCRLLPDGAADRRSAHSAAAGLSLRRNRRAGCGRASAPWVLFSYDGRRPRAAGRSTSSGAWPWTPPSGPTPATRVRPWRWLRSPTCCGAG